MNIDYDLLDEQVSVLLNIRYGVVTQDRHKDALDGVIEMLEAIQDEKEETYTIYYDCNNCGNSYREGEVPKDLKCTCGETLVKNKIKDE